MTSVRAEWKTLTLHDWGMQAQSGFASGKHNSERLGIIHLRPMNISSDGRVVLNEVKHVEDNSGRRVQQGDVLFNNTNSDVWVGKTAYISSEHSFAFSNHMTRLRFPDNLIDPKFMAMKLHSLWMMGYFKEICSNHVNQASVSTRRLSQIQVSIPSIAEQRRIVEILEDHLSRLDAALADVKQARVKATQFRRSLFQAAFSDTLTLQGIVDLSELPADWREVSIKDVADVIRGVTYSKSQTMAKGMLGAVPLLRATNLEPGRLIYEDMVYVPESVVKPKQILQVDDIILAASSGSISVVGKSAQVRNSNGETFGAFCAVVRPKKVLGRYLGHWVQSPFVRDYWSSLAKGTNINNLKSSDIEGTKIPLPSVARQHQIVEILEDHLSRLDASMKIANKIEQDASSLRRSLLQAAFTGQLTREAIHV
ncbi:MAG: restriction endonuclease subunit S [Candidatus Nanopelagicaceae bacterium]|nr:restriction endonuclease subunit S [Candidatus Nanopelagicaceae bacterium]